MTDSLLARAEAVHSKVAAASVLWKYADPDGNEFYLLKKLTPVRSPYSGKSFTVKPERVSLSDVGKELKSDAKAEKAKKADVLDFWKAASQEDAEGEQEEAQTKTAAEAKGKTLPGTLWEYADEDGNKFYLPKKQPGALKSPFTGKTFTAKPTKNTLSDVSKDIKEQSKKASEQEEHEHTEDCGHEKAAEQEQAQDDAQGEQQDQGEQEQQKEASEDLWKVDPAFGVLAQEEKKPEQAEEGQQKAACEGGACKCSGTCGCSKGGEEQQEKAATSEAEAILTQGESHPALKVLLAAYQDVAKAVEAANSVKAAADGVPDLAAALVLARVKPAVEKLARVSAIVAKQMEAKIK